MLLRTHNAVLLMLLGAHNAELLMLLQAHDAVLLTLERPLTLTPPRTAERSK